MRPSGRLGACETGLGAFDEKVALELGDGVDDVHGHHSGGAGQVHAARGKAVEAYARSFRIRDCTAGIGGIAPQPIKPADDENVACDAMGETLAFLALLVINRNPFHPDTPIATRAARSGP